MLVAHAATVRADLSYQLSEATLTHSFGVDLAAHDPNRTPGGSSSGSPAAVADFHVPVSLGTQTAGSVIRPASFNGVVGFKVTWGSISREGMVFSSATLDTLGFFTRSVADLDLLASVFHLADDEPVPSGAFTLKGAKFGLCKSAQWPLAGKGTQDAMALAADLLRKQGAMVEDVELPDDFAKVRAWHGNVMAGDGKTVASP
jgi:amidase